MCACFPSEKRNWFLVVGGGGGSNVEETRHLVVLCHPSRFPRDAPVAPAGKKTTRSTAALNGPHIHLHFHLNIRLNIGQSVRNSNSVRGVERQRCRRRNIQRTNMSHPFFLAFLFFSTLLFSFRWYLVELNGINGVRNEFERVGFNGTRLNGFYRVLLGFQCVSSAHVIHGRPWWPMWSRWLGASPAASASSCCFGVFSFLLHFYGIFSCVVKDTAGVASGEPVMDSLSFFSLSLSLSLSLSFLPHSFSSLLPSFSSSLFVV